jgi:hypothetical protein
MSDDCAYTGQLTECNTNMININNCVQSKYGHAQKIVRFPKYNIDFETEMNGDLVEPTGYLKLSAVW